jgi:hypothetical protein
MRAVKASTTSTDAAAQTDGPRNTEPKGPTPTHRRPLHRPSYRAPDVLTWDELLEFWNPIGRPPWSGLSDPATIPEIVAAVRQWQRSRVHRSRVRSE